jgi:hypothetical protein
MLKQQRAREGAPAARAAAACWRCAKSIGSLHMRFRSAENAHAAASDVFYRAGKNALFYMPREYALHAFAFFA